MMQTQKQAPSLPKRERRRPQISCTECRRRKQKCNVRKDGPCTNCMRRYPPVECFVQPFKGDQRVPGYGNTPREPTTTHNWHSHITNHVSSSSSSSTNTPIPTTPTNERPREKYQSIPLSHILHPQSEELLYPHYVSDTPHSIVPSLQQKVCTIKGEDIVDEDDIEEIVPERQNLKFMDPGMKDVMYKRMNIGGSPRTVGGMLEMLNSFNVFPVKTTLRNAELFNYYHQYVAPRLCSVDGSFFHPLFAREILPWQIQSTLMPNVAILMASATQGYLQDPTSEMSSETLVIKDHVLKLVNKFIREDFNVIGNQAMRIVIHLVIIEWWWGSYEALWFHMEGIRKMLEMRGGFAKMEDPLNANVLIVTDYELACGFEVDLYLQTTEEALSAQLPVRDTYPEKFRCPLLHYPTTFVDCRDVLGLYPETAQVLDDLRFLITTITAPMLDSGLKHVERSKISATASWINQRIITLLHHHHNAITTPSHQEIINTTILLASQLFTHCISTINPFRQSFSSPSTSSSTSTTSSLDPTLFNTLLTNILLVPLSTWGQIPGIFFFILLVATPPSEGDYRGRFLRKQQACTGMSISLEDFLLGIAYLRSFWAVQVWIRREKGNG